MSLCVYIYKLWLMSYKVLIIERVMNLWKYPLELSIGKNKGCILSACLAKIIN